MTDHACSQPLLGPVGGMVAVQRPDWECGVCGRVWRHIVDIGTGWWAEVRGPSVTSAGSEDAGSLRFVTKVFSEAFDLLYGSQYIGAWTANDIDSWTRRVGRFCSQYEHIARAGQRIRAELAAAHDKASDDRPILDDQLAVAKRLMAEDERTEVDGGQQ